MADSCLRILRCDNLPNRFRRRIMILRRFVRQLLKRIIACSPGKPRRYLMLPRSALSPSLPPPPGEVVSSVDSGSASDSDAPICHNGDSPRKSDSDLVRLKICLLGDQQIGKTSFLAQYVGNKKGLREGGMNVMAKTLCVRGARISYTIWEVEGNENSRDQIPLACKDSLAILFMFDLTSRCTLNNIVSWYQQARKWNQTAIPILVGTKFDEFIQLSIDLQWTIASEARTYAKALNATLFFSSATYNINVNKIFKLITAKLFDLPWNVERNLNVGEPLIDF